MFIRRNIALLLSLIVLIVSPVHAAQYGQIFQFLLSQSRTSTGSLPGGKVYFYAPGTTDLKTVWTDRAKTTPAANPYTLDANGTAQLYGDGVYDVKITDSTDVQKYYRYNVDVSWPYQTDSIDNYASLNAAVAAIGSTPTDLTINSSTTVTVNLTVPANIRLIVYKTGSINQGSYTLTINGPLENNGTVTGSGALTLAGVYSGFGTINVSGAITINGPFDVGPIQVFTGLGVVTGVKEARPEWWGADATGSTDAAAAIQKAIDSGARRIYCGDSVYKVASTIYLTSKNGLTWEFNRSGLGVYNLRWYGGAAPVVEVSGPNSPGENIGFSIDLKNLAINGNAGGTRATIGLSLGKFNAAYNVLTKYINTENLQVANCRVGLLLGFNAAVSSDVSHQNHKLTMLTGNVDAGLLGNSGNAANILFENPVFSGNGTAPTTDTLNPSGIGSNAHCAAGEYTFIAGSSDGLGATKPTTSDFYVTGASVKINGWWSDTHGPFMVQNGANQTMYLNGVRHYEVSMTDTTTPKSIDISGEVLLNGCYFFGDVYATSGQGGRLTSSAVKFHSPSAGQRDVLGQGTYKGDQIVTYKKLLGINTGETSLLIGGGNRAKAVVGDKATAIQVLGAGNAFPLLNAAGATGESGFTMQLEESDGAVRFVINGYPSGTDGNGTTYKCHKVGWVYIYIIGRSGTLAMTGYKKQYTTTSEVYGIGDFVAM